MIKDIAAKLLGRQILKDEGIPESVIEEAEDRLGFRLPFALREFYLSIGNIEVFSSAFNRFAPPDELFEDDGMLFFLEENQSVCMWAVSAVEAGYDNPSVHMLVETDEGDEWYEEEITLPEFIRMMLYYQLAMGGDEELDGAYKFTAMMSEDEIPDDIGLMVADWEKTVDYNGFTAYFKEGRMLWYMSTEDKFDIFYQTRDEDDFSSIVEEFGFGEL